MVIYSTILTTFVDKIESQKDLRRSVKPLQWYTDICDLINWVNITDFRRYDVIELIFHINDIMELLCVSLGPKRVREDCWRRLTYLKKETYIALSHM